MKYIINEMLLDLNLGRKYAIRTEFVESGEVDLVPLVVPRRGNKARGRSAGKPLVCGERGISVPIYERAL